MEIRKVLFNNRGSGYPLAVVIALALVIIFSGVSEYFRLMIIASGVRDALQSAVIEAVNDNYSDVYHGVREGYSGGYQPLDSFFEESLNYGDIYDRLESVLGLSREGRYRLKRTHQGTIELKIWDLDVNIHNAPFASGDIATRRFKVDSSIMLEVPVSFAGKLLPPMRIKVKNSAGYTPKF